MAYVPFKSDFEVESVTIYAENLERLSNGQRAAALEAVNTYGFAIISRPQPLDTEKQLLAIAKHFGGIVMHDKSEGNGITTIRANNDALYLSQSNAEHDFHTDCTYMHANFAKVVMLQCVKPCDEGGDSLLFSAINGFRFMEQHHPKALRALQTGKVRFKRGHAIGERPVFSDNVVSGGRLAFTFRHDTVAELTFSSEETRDAYEILTHYMHLPENVLQFRMEANQILVLDNIGVAHGRTAYSPTSGRTVHRLQLDGEAPGLNLGIATQKSDKRDVFYRDLLSAGMPAGMTARKVR